MARYYGLEERYWRCRCGRKLAPLLLIQLIQSVGLVVLVVVYVARHHRRCLRRSSSSSLSTSLVVVFVLYVARRRLCSIRHSSSSSSSTSLVVVVVVYVVVVVFVVYVARRLRLHDALPISVWFPNSEVDDDVNDERRRQTKPQDFGNNDDEAH